MELNARKAKSDTGGGRECVHRKMGKKAAQGFRRVVSFITRVGFMLELTLRPRWHFAKSNNVLLPDEYDA